MSIEKDLYLLRYAIGEMDFWTLLNWGVLATISIILWQVLSAQNKRYKELVGEDAHYNEERNALLRLAKIRGSVLLLLWLMLVLLLIVVDVGKQVNRSRNYLLATQDVAIKADAKNPYQEEMLVTTELQQPPAPSTELPPSLEKIKSSYEDAFVSLMILQKCNLAGEVEQNALYASLLKVLGFSDKRVQIAKTVMNAASGSYHSLYDGVRCDGANIKNTQTNFALFMKQVEAD